eukprot:934054-Lingulodinium_polyedra.AAC.1
MWLTRRRECARRACGGVAATRAQSQGGVGAPRSRGTLASSSSSSASHNRLATAALGLRGLGR